MKPELWTLVERNDVASLLDGLAESEGMTIHRLGSLTEPLGLDEPDGGIVLAIEMQRDTAAHAGAIRRLRRNFIHFDVIEFVEGEVPPSFDGADLRVALPADPEDFYVRAARLIALRRIKTESGIIGRSDALNEMLDTILQVAPTEVSVLIVGESGSGKELTAKAIHLRSRRNARAFEAVNCGSLAEGVLESELFGHEKGSFTGAVARRRGLFERAHGGTLFLDEVGEMSLGMQVKLLRVIESGEFLRVGGIEKLHSDVRLLTATNRELETSVDRGEFRKDLYYRLKVVQIRVPPLRARPEDIPVLARFFLRQSAARHGKTIRGIDRKGMEVLVRHPWPGNIRELSNMMDSLIVLTRESMIRSDEIERRLQERAGGGLRGVPDLPVHVQRSRDEVERELILNTLLSLHNDVREIHRMLAEAGIARHGGGRWGTWAEVEEASEEPPADLGAIEREAIREALARNSGNRRKTARQLGVSERTLYRRLKEYGIG